MLSCRRLRSLPLLVVVIIISSSSFDDCCLVVIHLSLVVDCCVVIHLSLVVTVAPSSLVDCFVVVVIVVAPRRPISLSLHYFRRRPPISSLVAASFVPQIFGGDVHRLVGPC